MLSFKKTFLFLPIIICFFIGIIFFIIQKSWIIIQWPFASNLENVKFVVDSATELHKKVKFFYYKDERFLEENVDLLWIENKSENLKHLINNWFVFLREERLVDKPYYLETVAFADDLQTVYLSFNKSFLDQEWSIFKKSNFMESLLKTISYSDLGVKNLIFLVNHQEMEDYHLDFSRCWPIYGFGDTYY
ncbi:hypothetical protein GF322_00925 [Candidatus Dependentiae bacterium]|nr:hypothetical protein [Candidatus Dependentiae bacterium]